MRSTKNVVASTTDADGQELLVRWVVLFTGTTATADYEPTGSAGETPELVREVSSLCVQFHPHSEIRLFPRDREVYLYWRARSTGDHVVTRVTTAPNPDGMRTALEYVSLLFDGESFERIGNNPFLIRTLKLADFVRDTFLSQKRDPLSLMVPAGAESAAFADAPDLPDNNALSTPENIQALEEYVASGTTETPPTFATWWVSRGYVPENTFQIVLRASTPQAMTLREATDLASEMATRVKSAIPNVSGGDAVAAGLVSALMTNSDAIIAEISAAADRVNSESTDQFREHLADASRKATQMSSDLASLEKRLDNPASATRLAELAAQYQGFVPEVLKIRHPNPFGGRKNRAPAAFAGSAPAVSADTRNSNGYSDSRQNASSTTAGKKNNSGLIGASAAAAAVIVGLAAWKLAPSTNKPANPGSGGQGSIATPAPKQPKPVAVKPSVPVTPEALLNQYADEVVPIASAKARAAATQSVSDNKKEPDDTDLKLISANAITAAYKETLRPVDFAQAFSNTENWTYARYRKTLPTLLPAVLKAAGSAATVAFTEIKKSQEAVARSASTPEPVPTPIPEPTHRTRHKEETPTPKPTRTPRLQPTPRSHIVTETTHTKSPRNGTGSAASSGL